MQRYEYNADSARAIATLLDCYLNIFDKISSSSKLSKAPRQNFNKLIVIDVAHHTLALLFTNMSAMVNVL